MEKEYEQPPSYESVVDSEPVTPPPITVDDERVIKFVGDTIVVHATSFSFTNHELATAVRQQWVLVMRQHGSELYVDPKTRVALVVHVHFVATLDKRDDITTHGARHGELFACLPRTDDDLVKGVCWSPSCGMPIVSLPFVKHIRDWGGSTAPEIAVMDAATILMRNSGQFFCTDADIESKRSGAHLAIRGYLRKSRNKKQKLQLLFVWHTRTDRPPWPNGLEVMRLHDLRSPLVAVLPTDAKLLLPWLYENF